MIDKKDYLPILNSLRIHASDDHTFYCNECIAFKTFKTHECHTCSQYLAKISADLIEQLIADETTQDKRKTPSLFECKKCGWESWDTYTCDDIKYCPGCGRRVIYDKC